MSQMEINRVLEQIRSMSAQTRVGTTQAQNRLGTSQGVNPTPQSGPGEFASILRAGLDQVNQTEQKANQLSDAFQRGTPGVELPQVMLEVSKASVSLKAVSEVRNRLVSAYQDIMNMQM
ncbi:MAG TPA: flagellar hook-basal body complex protein FliE [Steroidobacteraceae bacterium]|nr:flagellar hook-basal body complex protein FliE [Steroidobacteraceae bacterium]